MIRLKFSRPARRRGATIVEMAIVAPVFFVLVLAIIESARMVMIQQALTNAAREGCRHAVLSTTLDASEVDTAVRTYLSGVTPSANDSNICQVTMTPADLTTAQPGTEVTVSVQIQSSHISWMPAGHLRHVVLRGLAGMNRE